MKRFHEALAGNVHECSPSSRIGKARVFIDKRLATAIVDRFMHHHRLIEITGESWRHKHRD
jgi:DNA replication protein DnaC